MTERWRQPYKIFLPQNNDPLKQECLHQSCHAQWWNVHGEKHIMLYSIFFCLYGMSAELGMCWTMCRNNTSCHHCWYCVVLLLVVWLMISIVVGWCCYCVVFLLGGAVIEKYCCLVVLLLSSIVVEWCCYRVVM